MQLRYNYRVYPGPGHRQALARAFGCVRVVINDGLRARQDAHAAGLPYLTDAQLSARLTAAKATPGRAWLGEVSSVVLQQGLADLNAAYRRFFGYRAALREWTAAGRKGPRPREAGLPRRLRPDWPVGAHQPGVLGVRAHRRAQAAPCPRVDVPGVRCRA